MGCCASEEISPLQPFPPQGGLEKKKDVAAIGSKSEDPTAGRKKKWAKKTPIKLGYWKIRGLA